MLNKILYCLSFYFLLVSCKNDCYTDPTPIIFEFVNAQGDNLIENGALSGFTIQEEASNGNSSGVQLT